MNKIEINKQYGVKTIYERIEKMINNHQRHNISIYTDNTFKDSITTTYYGYCKIEYCTFLEKWMLDFYIENNLIHSIDLSKVEYDMNRHDLYIKGEE